MRGSASRLVDSIYNKGVLAPEWIMCLSGSYTLTDTTSEQKLFNGSTNGAITLPTGTYFFDCCAVLTAMSSTSGNCAFDILGAGTATIGSVFYHVVGVDVTAVTGTAARSGLFSTSAQTAASMVSAGAGTAMGFQISNGVFRITTEGTIIPSITLVTAGVTPAVAANSYFKCRKVGSSTMTTVGAWT